MSEFFYSMFIIFAKRHPIGTMIGIGFVLALLIQFWSVVKKNLLLAIPYAVLVLSITISTLDVFVLNSRDTPMEYSFLIIFGFIAGFAIFNLKAVFKLFDKIF